MALSVDTEKELKAMKETYIALKPLNEKQRERVLKWVTDRLNYELSIIRGNEKK